jgi:hypothetical protein
MSKEIEIGVNSGLNLISLDDVATWERVEDHCKEVIKSIPNLSEYERDIEDLKSNSSRLFFTKAELQKVVLWKHTVGKNRIYNVKYLNANTEEAVRIHSAEAIRLAKQIKITDYLQSDGALTQTGRRSIQDTIGALGKLKGVGPATASAILTLVRPDVFCYLYDEVIDCFEQQRDYKISNYLRVNSRCLQIAHKLGKGWTTARVAKSIWTAARYLAASGADDEVSKHDDNDGNKEESGSSNDDDNNDEKKPAANPDGQKRKKPKQDSSDSSTDSFEHETPSMPAGSDPVVPYASKKGKTSGLNSDDGDSTSSSQTEPKKRSSGVRRYKKRK